MNLQMIFAGFGGQGVLLMGQLIAYAGMVMGKEVSWMPSYGPEMRGGSANCSVVVSDEPVGSPRVEDADVVVAMNIPANDIAAELGSAKVTNMVMLGAVAELTGDFTAEELVDAMRHKFGPSKEHMMPKNREAIERGMAAAKG